MVQAYLKRDKSRDSCVLLEEDGLCMIHKNHGDQYLSETCSVYPRNLLIFARLFLTSTAKPKMEKCTTNSSYQPNIRIKNRSPYLKHTFSMRDLLFRLMEQHSEYGLFRIVLFCKESTSFFHNEISHCSQESKRSLYKIQKRQSHHFFLCTKKSIYT